MKLNSTHKLTVVGKVSAKEAGKVALIMVYTKLFFGYSVRSLPNNNHSKYYQKQFIS